MTEGIEGLSDDALEARLVELGFATDLGGRLVESQKSAIRTVLARRASRRGDTDVDARQASALELVNAARGPDEQLTAVDPIWAASILASPGWAALYASDEEMHARPQEGR